MGYARKPAGTTGHSRVFVSADGKEVLTKSELRGVDGVPPGHGVWIGGGIGLVIDVIFIASVASLHGPRVRGPDLNTNQ